MPEEDDVGIAVDKGTQPQASNRGHEGIARLSVGAVIRCIVFPDRSDIAADANAVVDADGRDNERTRAEQVDILTQPLTQKPGTDDVGIVTSDLIVVAHAVDGGRIDKIGLHVADARIDEGLGEVTQVFLSERMGCVKGVVRASPVVSGDGKLPRRGVHECLGMLAEERRAGPRDEGGHPDARSHPQRGDICSASTQILAKFLVSTPVAHTLLPAVVDLERVEPQLRESR